jgi:uncharacterized protein YbjT (DUF2867 family)
MEVERMAHLILGGTGTVGSEVVRSLLAAGEKVRVVTRSAEKSAALPAGATGVVGDLEDMSTYPEIFDGAKTVFLLNPVSMTELHQGLAAVNESRRVGARHVVYLSVQNVERGAHLPHFASKIGVERALRESGVPFTALYPSNFYQNDNYFRDAILQYGVYPQPLGSAGVTRVDVRDIGQAAVNAFRRGAQNRGYSLVGPDALTGESCARIWSETLGREIRYAGDDLDAWAQQQLQWIPSWMVYDFGLMYAMFQREGLKGERQLDETRDILGAEPRRFADFARESAAAWQESPAPA